MSFLARIIQRFRPNRYVGQDLIGNRFYEHPSSSDDPRRTKRTVQYRNPEDVWQYIGGGKRLAVQWSSWLSHTRPHPPTLEELQVDAARQQRVQANVALIEARDREERAMVLQLQQHQSGAATIEPPQESDITATTHTQEARQQPQVDPVPKNTLPKMATSADPYEPEPWTPRARARR